MGASNEKRFFSKNEHRDAYKGDNFTVYLHVHEKKNRTEESEKKIIDEPPIIYISI